MNNPTMVAGLAGLAAAVLYASHAVGSLLSVLLVFVAPLPLFIAGFGWGTYAAVVGGGVGSGLVAIAATPEAGLLFLATVAVPVVILSHLTLLSRGYGDEDGQQRVEWYPAGRIVLWAAALSAGLIGLSVITLGPGADAFETALGESVRSIIEVSEPFRQRVTGDGRYDIAAVVALMVWAIPPASAVLWLVTTLGNMWFASLIVARSGRAVRPRERFHDFVLPPATPFVLAAAFFLSFLPGVVGIVSTAMVAAVVVAFMLQGLVAMHVITAGHPFRPTMLTIAYAALFLTSWIGIAAFALFGVADALLGVRRKFSGGSGPPMPT